jgi:hypothetical protein
LRAIVSTLVAAVFGVGLAIATQAWLPDGVTAFIAIGPLAMGTLYFSWWEARTRPGVDNDRSPGLHQPRRSDAGTIEVESTLPGVKGRLTGRYEARQKRNAERAYAHPFVYSVVHGSLWGLTTGLVLSRTLGGVVYWLVFGNLLFGPWVAWQARHRHQRNSDEPTRVG